MYTQPQQRGYAPAAASHGFPQRAAVPSAAPRSAMPTAMPGVSASYANASVRPSAAPLAGGYAQPMRSSPAGPSYAPGPVRHAGAPSAVYPGGTVNGSRVAAAPQSLPRSAAPSQAGPPGQRVPMSTGGHPGMMAGHPGMAGGHPGMMGGQPGIAGHPVVMGGHPGMAGGHPGMMGGASSGMVMMGGSGPCGGGQGGMVMMGGPGPEMFGGPMGAHMGAMVAMPTGQQSQEVSMDDLPFTSKGHKAMWEGIFEFVQTQVKSQSQNLQQNSPFSIPRIPMPDIPDAQMGMLFDSYDMSRSGQLDKDQLKELMQDMQCVSCLAMKKEKAEAMQETTREMAQVMGPQMAAMMSGAASQAYDMEMQMVKAISCQDVPDEAAHELLKELDADRDGVVSRLDFLQTAKKALFDPNPPEEVFEAMQGLEAMLMGGMGGGCGGMPMAIGPGGGMPGGGMIMMDGGGMSGGPMMMSGPGGGGMMMMDGGGMSGGPMMMGGPGGLCGGMEVIMMDGGQMSGGHMMMGGGPGGGGIEEMMMSMMGGAMGGAVHMGGPPMSASPMQFSPGGHSHAGPSMMSSGGPTTSYAGSPVHVSSGGPMHRGPGVPQPAFQPQSHTAPRMAASVPQQQQFRGAVPSAMPSTSYTSAGYARR